MTFHSLKGNTFWFYSIWRTVILQFCLFLKGPFQFYEIWFREEDCLVLDHCISATKTCQGMSKIHLTVSCVSHFYYVRKYTFWKNAFSKASWYFTLLHTMFHFKMECWKNTFSCVVVIAIMPKRLKGVQLNFFSKKKKCNTRFERVFRL